MPLSTEFASLKHGRGGRDSSPIYAKAKRFGTRRPRSVHPLKPQQSVKFPEAPTGASAVETRRHRVAAEVAIEGDRFAGRLRDLAPRAVRIVQRVRTTARVRDRVTAAAAARPWPAMSSNSVK